MAAQRKIQEEREARELAEKAEPEKIEAKESEVAGKAQMISDPRVDNLEKSLEEIKAEQKEFKEALKKQTESQNETKSMLDMIWEKLKKT